MRWNRCGTCGIHGRRWSGHHNLSYSESTAALAGTAGGISLIDGPARADLPTQERKVVSRGLQPCDATDNYVAVSPVVCGTNNYAIGPSRAEGRGPPPLVAFPLFLKGTPMKFQRLRN